MNTQLAKKIRKYVGIKMKEEHIPQSDEKRLYKIFKRTYEEASPEMQKQYVLDMETKFLEYEKQQHPVKT